MHAKSLENSIRLDMKEIESRDNHNSTLDSAILHSLKKSQVEAEESNSYPEGAWELFLSTQIATTRVKRAKIRRALLYSAAAAAVLLTLIVGKEEFTANKKGTIESPSTIVASNVESSKVKLPHTQEVGKSVIKSPLNSVDVPAVESVTTEELSSTPHPVRSPSAPLPDITISVADSRVTSAVAYKPSSVTTTIPTLHKESGTPSTASPATYSSTVQSAPRTTASTYPFIERSRKPIEKSARHFKFGLNFAPSFVSASSNDLLNYIGGVVVEYRLSPSFSLSTALQLEQQSLQIENISAHLVGLDIPLNLNWKLHSNTNGSIYLAGGFSSVTYLQERFATSTFRNEIKSKSVVTEGENSLATLQITAVESREERLYTSPEKIEFAGRLNLAIGYEQPLGSLFTIQLEPFLKIPLRGLTHEKLRLFNGGVAFKILF